MSMPIVVRRPVDSPPLPGPRQLQRRFSEPDISYLHAVSHAHRTASGAQVAEVQRAESSSTIVNPMVEPHVGPSVTPPSTSSSTTIQSSAIESVATTSVTGSLSPPTTKLKSTISANRPRLARSFTCLRSVPTPKADFFTSPSQSFDAYYAAHASDEEWVRPSSSKFTRHGRKSGPLRRRHTTGRLTKENKANWEQDYVRTSLPVQNKVYHRLIHTNETACSVQKFRKVSRRRHTTGRTRKDRETEEPAHARTGVLVQNRVYDIDDDNHSPVTLSASVLVKPSPAASEESHSQVGLGIGIGSSRGRH
ncbi:hypothetical protein C0992_000481 [Termitomyces sp. T32_za158]|nr:hypothetical protein C0992_000481 [Termitomyces sp. T32_za158]